MNKPESIDIQFVNQRGLTLSAKLELPNKPTRFAIFSPCFTCTKETLASYRISQLLAKKNIAVLRIDFTGLGNSQGDFGEGNFSTQVADIISANDYLNEYYQAPSLLIGHSFGGTASYQAAQQLNNIKGVVSIASPSSPAHVTSHFGAALELIKANKAASFSVAGKSYPIKPQFLDDLKNYNLPDSLSKADFASLIFHAEGDQLVAIDHAYQLFEKLPQPKSIVSLNEADHILSSRKDSEYIAKIIDIWAQALG